MSKKLNTKIFVERAIKKYGYLYTFEETNYINAKTKIKITCKVHGIFETLPDNFLSKNTTTGCKRCACVIANTKIPKKIRNPSKTTEQFIRDAKQKFGNKFTYEKIDYKNSKTRVTIFCKEHAYFSITPNAFLSSDYGCPKCGIKARGEGQKGSGFSKFFFLEKAKEKFGTRFDYSNIEFVNFETHIKIICPKHGEYSQKPREHLKSIHGCWSCSRETPQNKYTKKDFIRVAKEKHGNEYDYSKVKYKNSMTPVEIICGIHGIFFMTPSNHNHPSKPGRCPQCSWDKIASERMMSKKEYLERVNLIHGNRYEYLDFEFKGLHQKIQIICPIHGKFKQSANNHIRGSGCPRCFNKSEGRIAIILNQIGVVHKQYNIENKFFDFYLPEYQLIIERDGEQHYRGSHWVNENEKLNSLVEQQENDKYKLKLVKDAGLRLCRIPYWLSPKEEEKEIFNIISGNPTYPELPSLDHEITRPKPK